MNQGNHNAFPKKASLVASSEPGTQVTLLSNHFRMKVEAQGLVHIYSIDFGSQIEEKD